MLRRSVCLLLLAAGVAAAADRRPLVVISIDGLDHRYLRDRDRLGLRIPNLRRLIEGGAWSGGVVGIVPTVTWPSHTTMITGVRSDEHGILGNRRPRSDGGEYYWSVSLLKAKTLWHATRAAKLKSAAITWPVTVDADIDFNLPEAFSRRNGGGMDLATIESKATPGLVKKISARYPSFPQEWMDDRTRTLATVWLLENERPDLILLHFVDHDAAAHDHGPFTREALSIIELTDEYVGQILKALPADGVVALVSDHGFERIDRIVDINALAAKLGTPGALAPLGGLITARDPAAAEALRKLSRDPASGIGREVPREELLRFAPGAAGIAAAFESVEHVMFGGAASEKLPKGEHGLWPGRKDYRATFLLWGKGITRARLPEMSMLEIASKLAAILDVPLN